MTTYQKMPDMTPNAYEELKADIRLRGMLVPVVVDEDGTVIDGHHRKRAAEELGIACRLETISGLSEEEKVARALSLNVKRRHLLRDQIHSLLDQQLRSTPEQSDRKIAEIFHVDHKSVGKRRKVVESTGDVPQLNRRVGRDGKARRATRRVVEDDLPETPKKIQRVLDPKRVCRNFEASAIEARRLLMDGTGQAAANDARYFAPRLLSLLRLCLRHLDEREAASIRHEFELGEAGNTESAVEAAEDATRPGGPIDGEAAPLRAWTTP